MKYFSFLLIFLNFAYCLNAKKSSFDIQGNPLLALAAILNFGDTEAPIVSISNLKSKGTLQTGSISGTASDNKAVSKIEIQINSGTYEIATGTTTWTYKIPLTAKWNYSFTNTINIRATDSSGNVSVTSLTNIQKGENQDINGDGFVDLVVAAPSNGGGNGKVYVFQGTASGITQTNAVNASQSFSGSTGRKFGSSIAMTDINADGFADLVVCEYNNTASGALKNSAFYFLGSSTGFGVQITINQVGASDYCNKMIVGDFNSDGYGDAIISDLTANGNLYVHYGSSTGLNSSPNQTITIASGVSNLGQGLVAGDINGDGLLDLVSTSSGTPNQILLFLNSSSGFTSSATSSIPGLNSSSNLILGDFNNDGKADLAVACTNTCLQSGTNEVQIFYSNGTTLNTTPNARIQKEASGGVFNPATLSAGDFNGDGITDLIIGDDSGSFSGVPGKIYGISGSASGICNSTCNVASLATFTIVGNGTSRFGGNSRLKDYNGDGLPDLFISGFITPSGTNADGTVYIFNGTSTGFSSTSAANASMTITGTTSSSEQFGIGVY